MSSILAPIQPATAGAIAIHADGSDSTDWTANLAHNDRIVSFTHTKTGKTYHTVDALRAAGIKKMHVTYRQEINIA